VKRIIDGRRYDTEKAQEIGIGYSGDSGATTLYRKRTGEYFVLSVTDNNAAIIPVNIHEARIWARQYLSPAEYAAAFGPESSPSALYVEIGHELMAGLRAGASADGITLKAHVERILREALENPNQK